MPTQAGRRALACLAVLIASGAAHAATKVTITSPAGEPLGGGVGTRTYTAPTATIGWSNNESYYGIAVSQGGDYYSILLQAPAGQTLLPGTYSNAELSSRVTGLAPGMRIVSHNGECADAWGSFVIRQGGPFEEGKLEATFTFRCGSATAPALTGTIYLDAAPRYFSYSRDAGFPMGSAASKSYYGNNSETFGFGDAEGLYMSARGRRDKWHFRFTPPLGRTFAKGLYTLANEATAEHAGLEMMELDKDTFCAGMAGSLNVRGVVHDEWGSVTGLYATWTVTCDGQPAAFRGTFHHDL